MDDQGSLTRDIKIMIKVIRISASGTAVARQTM